MIRMLLASPRRGAALALCLSVPLAAQARVWIVDASNGPGTNFRDLPEAVAAAAPGDALRVRAGSYRNFTVRRGLSLFAEPGSVVDRTNQSFQDVVRIEGVPATEEVSITGLRIDTTSIPTLGRPFVIVACQGTVVLEGVFARHRPSSMSITGSPAVWVQGSRLLLLTGCTLEATPAVFAEGSTLVVNSTTCTGPDFSGGVLEVPGPGVRAFDSSVTLARCTLQGGSVLQNALPFTLPGAGLESTRSRWLVLGGGAIRAGTRTGFSAPALAGDGTVTLDPATTLVASGGAQPIAPGFAVTMAALPSLQATGARIGNAVQLHLIAQPNDVGVIVLGWLGTPLDLGLGSPLMLDVTRPTLATPGLTASGTGDIRFSFTAPNDSALVGFRCSWQGIAGSAARGFLLSNPDAYLH